MEEAQKYTVENLLTDDKFLEWVHSNGQEHDRYWQDRLLNEAPPVRLVFDQAKELALALTISKTSVDSSLAFQQLQNNLKNSSSLRPVKPLYARNILKVAASIALVCSLLYFFWPQTQSFQTAYGEIQTITLPDETVVTLRANSKLWWDGNWEQNEKRTVYLEGEAYFDVRPINELDAKRSFIVHATPLKVEVIGTEFNLVNRPSRSQVVLVEGKVAVKGDDHKQYELKPQQALAWNIELNQAVIETVDPSFYTDWQKNIWRFENTTLNDAMLLIEEHFGKTIVFTNPSLKSRKLNGSAPSSSLETLLNGIKTSLNISIINKGDRIIIDN